MPAPRLIRNTPRISVNKLGEFLTTRSPTRRRRLIHDQKQPPSVVVPRYAKALEPIAKFLASGCADPGQIADAIAKLRNTVPKSDWVADDNKNTIAALEHFLTAATLLPIDGATYIKGDKDARPLVIAGVQISVRPDFILRVRKKDKVSTGAMKIHYIKDEEKALTEDGQEYVAMLCHEWNTKYGAKAYPAVHSLSFSLDLFRQNLVSAPKSVKRRMNEIEAACTEIALVWPIV
jgi:hypothetical protein